MKHSRYDVMSLKTAKKSNGGGTRVNARGSTRKNCLKNIHLKEKEELCVCLELEKRLLLLNLVTTQSLKRGRYGVIGLKTVKKTKGGCNRVNARGYTRRNSYLIY